MESVYKFTVSCLVCVFLLFAFNGVLNYIEDLTGYQTAEEIAVENGYTAYFDGEEVDIDKLDLSQYDTSVNHETQTIYITYKQKSNSSLYPVFIPYKY